MIKTVLDIKVLNTEQEYSDACDYYQNIYDDASKQEQVNHLKNLIASWEAANLKDI